jgi:hypothetical protein
LVVVVGAAVFVFVAVDVAVAFVVVMMPIKMIKEERERLNSIYLLSNLSIILN